MERLTRRMGRSWSVIPGCDLRTVEGMQAVVDRLAAYEDTGLTPEDIDALQKREQGFVEMLVNVSCGCAVSYSRLAELAQAEKDGRLVVLPCKTGDEVWTNFAMSGWYFRGKDRPYSAKVVFLGLNNSDDMGGGLINVMYGKYNHMMQFSFSEIGKTVFLTREEAEAALKKREVSNEAD